MSRLPGDEEGVGEPIGRSGDGFLIEQSKGGAGWSMVSPWGEAAVWIDVDVDTATKVFEILGPPNVPFVQGGVEEGGDG